MQRNASTNGNRIKAVERLETTSGFSFRRMKLLKTAQVRKGKQARENQKSDPRKEPEHIQNNISESNTAEKKECCICFDSITADRRKKTRKQANENLFCFPQFGKAVFLDSPEAGVRNIPKAAEDGLSQKHPGDWNRLNPVTFVKRRRIIKQRRR